MNITHDQSASVAQDQSGSNILNPPIPDPAHDDLANLITLYSTSMSISTEPDPLSNSNPLNPSTDADHLDPPIPSSPPFRWSLFFRSLAFGSVEPAATKRPVTQPTEQAGCRTVRRLINFFQQRTADWAEHIALTQIVNPRAGSTERPIEHASIDPPQTSRAPEQGTHTNFIGRVWLEVLRMAAGLPITWRHIVQGDITEDLGAWTFYNRLEEMRDYITEELDRKPPLRDED